MNIGSGIILAIAALLAMIIGMIVHSYLGSAAATLAGAVVFVAVARVLQETGDWWERL